jgi:hypothetical protein
MGMGPPWGQRHPQQNFFVGHGGSMGLRSFVPGRASLAAAPDPGPKAEHNHRHIGGTGFPACAHKPGGNGESRREISGKQPENERDTSATAAGQMRDKVPASAMKHCNINMLDGVKKFSSQQLTCRFRNLCSRAGVVGGGTRPWAKGGSTPNLSTR